MVRVELPCPATLIFHRQRQVESPVTTGVLSSADAAPIERSEMGAASAETAGTTGRFISHFLASNGSSSAAAALDFFAYSTR
jgi:hypothetical protein